jgi:hypothetical protein
LDVALGNAALSDYVQSSSSYSSFSSSSLVRTNNAITTTSHANDQSQPRSRPKLSTKDIITTRSSNRTTRRKKKAKQLLLRHTSKHTGAKETNVQTERDVVTPVVPVEEEQQHDEEEVEGNQDDAVVNESERNTHTANEEDEPIIRPTVRIIPPFSWETELQNTQTYIQSLVHVGRSRKPPRNKTRPYQDSLLFFHIPKTAGTAIESAAGTNPHRPLAWGSCRFNHLPKRDICHYPPNSKPCTLFLYFTLLLLLFSL